MACLHHNWQRTLRIVMIFPVIQVGIWWSMLSRDRLENADRTRQLIDKAGCNSDMSSSQYQKHSITSVRPPKSHFGPGRSKSGFLWRIILLKYTLLLTLSVMGAMITSTGLATSYITLNSFKLAPKGDLNYQIQCM
jgi:hypothetical protein